ncbi:MAG: ABC transporter ATP-binding protein [Gemmatimonadota bacterium]
MIPLLVADSVGKTFGTRRILTAASLEAFPGRVTFVAGRNGAGKSTLLRIAAGRLPPDSGFVRFAGKQYLRPLLNDLARDGMFYIPDREILSPSVPLQRQFGAIAARFDCGSYDELADTFGISALLDREPRLFSGGELRRAKICLAVYRRSKCLLADEPLRGINPQMGQRAWAVNREIAARRKLVTSV